MSRRPKDGAKIWSLNVRDVPIELYTPLHNAALNSEQEFGEWVIDALRQALENKREQKTKKRGKTRV
jgi:hypothetical protein